MRASRLHRGGHRGLPALAFTILQQFPDQACALTCYCLGHCQVPTDSTNTSEESCQAKPGAKCFSAVEEVFDTETGSLVPERTYGCLPPDEQGLLQCKGNLVPHINPTSIACCDDADFCNRGLSPMYKPSPPEVDIFGAHMGEAASLALLISLTLCFVLLVVFVTLVYLRFKRREDSEKNRQKYQRTALSDPDSGMGHNGCGGTLSELIEQSSGSGSGLPLLVQRTIAKQIHMVNPVGKGRYGEVWLAKWRGESVAVKVFFTTDEASWFRETEIYQTVLMRHENILGFIAADIRGTGGCTQMLLITDYHEHGSLHDFLKFEQLDEEQMIALAHSAASGLSHLHTEIQGTRPKPAIAHRDIKSRNILVKRDLTCAIADFGLAVRYDSIANEIDIGAPNSRVGTTRYMAPEVLNQTINVGSFESFKQADMYSFGLVLWELCRRTTLSKLAEDSLKITYSPSTNSISKSSLSNTASEELSCELPYFEYVNSDPSFEDMQAVVVAKKLRPGSSAHWHANDSLSVVSRLMKECWHDNPSARLSVLRVKKSLSSIRQIHYQQKNKDSCVSSSSWSTSASSFSNSSDKPEHLAHAMQQIA